MVAIRGGVRVGDPAATRGGAGEEVESAMKANAENASPSSRARCRSTPGSSS